MEVGDCVVLVVQRDGWLGAEVRDGWRVVVTKTECKEGAGGHSSIWGCPRNGD